MQIRVWLSHDGYRDPDDNLAMLLGAAQARGRRQVRQRRPGRRRRLRRHQGRRPVLHAEPGRHRAGLLRHRQPLRRRRRQPAGGGKLRLLQAVRRRGAEGARPGLEASTTCSPRTRAACAPGTSTPTSGRRSARPPRSSPTTSSTRSPRPAGRRPPPRSSSTRAGGGANVAAEAIGYLLNQGYSEAVLLKHFAVVQHGNNWVTNYEAAARDPHPRLHRRDLEPELRDLSQRHGRALPQAGDLPARPARPPSASPSTRRSPSRPGRPPSRTSGRARPSRRPSTPPTPAPTPSPSTSTGSPPRSTTGSRGPRRCRPASTGPT